MLFVWIESPCIVRYRDDCNVAVHQINTAVKGDTSRKHPRNHVLSRYEVHKAKVMILISDQESRCVGPKSVALYATYKHYTLPNIVTNKHVLDAPSSKNWRRRFVIKPKGANIFGSPNY